LAARQQQLVHAGFLAKLQAECVGRYENKLVALQLIQQSTLTNTELVPSASEIEAEQHWLQVGTIGTGEAVGVAMKEDCAQLRLMPWGSVAIRVILVEGGVDLDPALLVDSTGRVYTWLPLPIKSPLPLTVNGGFEISSNRRDLWSGNDMTGDGRQRSVGVTSYVCLLAIGVTHACFSLLSTRLGMK
jgi:hypothetical protein